MAKIILYGDNMSPPVRACLLTLKALNLEYEYVHVDLFTGQHMTEEFIKKNPLHAVPCLEIDGKFIGDSHAIITFLVSKYAKDDTLYPKDLLKRAVVDQRLHFESGVVYYALRNITAPLWSRNETQVPQHKIDAIIEVYNFLEVFLKETPYVASDHLTIADFSIVTTVSSLVAIAEIDSVKYPKLTAWIKRLASLPYYYDANEVGGQKYANILKSKNLTIVS